jgi:prepilin-type processing-associated H-X9-DG protein
MTTETLQSESEAERDEALVASVRMGEPASCIPFITHFGPPVFSYLYWLTGHVDDATEAFNDTVLNLYLNPSRARKEGSLRDWVYRHATHAALTRQAQQQRKRRSSLDNILRGGIKRGEDIPWSDWEVACRDHAGATPADMEALVAGLRRLDDTSRAALLLTVVAGLPLDAVAKSIRLSPAKTRRAITEALDRIMVPPGAPRDRKARKARLLAHGHVIGVQSAGQAARLDKRLELEPELQSATDDSAALHDRLQHLPDVSPTADFVGETTTYLTEGHAALESRMATWGFRFMLLTVPLFILAILMVLLLPAISRSREMALRASAADNLQALGQAFRAYSDRSQGNSYPPLAGDSSLWVPELDKLYPTYIKEAAQLATPGLNDNGLAVSIAEALDQSPPDWQQAQKLFAQSYVYLGYTLLDDRAMASFAQARSSEGGINTEGDVETVDRRFFRLRQGVEQFFQGDVNLESGTDESGPAKIPVMFEYFTTTGFGGNPEGANVLYLDGSVEYVPFGTAYPVNETVLALLKDGGSLRSN